MHVRIPVSRGTSSNWSGYASATNLRNPAVGSVSKVNGAWRVPKLAPTANHTYSSIWVGIDGYSSNSVEQIGTEHDWVNGKQINYAWYEMYPSRPFRIDNFPVEIGDLISASVTYEGNDVFSLVIINVTQKKIARIPTKYTILANAKRSSAEWIVEAPFSSGPLPLSDFQTVQFSNCWCVINSIRGLIDNANWQCDKINMAASRNIIKAITSNLINTQVGSNFSVTWKHE